eukprot:TRINITY_DN43670_c0_g1_i3.p1 TRINITY_DN43670_c0_g1~~TRINITY_DN43670_c0_g1_i3.p1  ORF type:complete len:326 (+),score=94.66 TRINITY_DN43670_c0_g1_i3:113-1090(+)
MLRSLVGSEMCIRDRYQRRVRGNQPISMPQRDIASFFSKPKKSNASMASTTAPKKQESPSSKRPRPEGEEGARSEVEDLTVQEAKRAKLAKLAATTGLGSKLHPSWHSALSAELGKPYFAKLDRFVAEEREKHQIFPPEDKVLSAFEHCPLDQVRVVILGQDPYHGPGQAHGLCFSIEDASSCKFPPSLRNIFKELAEDSEVSFKMPPPKHGDLSKWAKQGVLLLNSVLTVKKANANSHKGQGWETFTDAVVSAVNAKRDGVVFMLWGKPAQTKGARLNKSKHHVLTSVHPSPLSASRGWFGSNHFSKCNKLLVESGQEPIDWQI